MSKVIGVLVDDTVEWHAANNGPVSDLDTLCGIDAFDSAIGHNGTAKAPRGQKIQCRQCYDIWRSVTAMRLRESNFDVEG